MSHFDDVGDFHLKFGLPVAGEGHCDMPHLTDADTFLFRLNFIVEEGVSELTTSFRKKDLPGIADALVDLVYVAHGTAHYFGIPFNEV